MIRAAEMLVFGSLAAGLHLAALAQWPGTDAAGPPASTGAPVEVAAADAAMRRLVADWDRPPPVSAAPPMPAGTATPAPALPDAATLAMRVPAAPALSPPAAADAPPPEPAGAAPRPLSRPEPAAQAPAAGSAGAIRRTAPEPAAAQADRSALARSHGAAVRRALAAARTYPEAARARGIAGAASLEVTLGRDGRLLAARLVASSGSEALDRASIAAARSAGFPPAPADLAGSSFAYVVRLRYDLD